MSAFLKGTRARLAMTVAAVFLGLASVAAVAVWLLFSHFENAGIDSSLSAQTQSLLSGLEDVNGRVSFHGATPLPAQSADGIAIAALLVDKGAVLDSSGAATALEPLRPLIAEALSRGAGVAGNVSDGGHALRALATPVDLGTGSGAALIVTRPLAEVQAVLLQFGLLLALIVVLLTAVVAGLSYRLTGRAMRPVRAIASAARELSEHDLHRRLGLDLPDDELGELAATFDAMLARLEAAFEALRRFTADAAHELRAPLAVLRAELEVSLRRSRSEAEYRASQRVALAEVERLSRLAEQLLTLAQADAGALQPGFETVDLSDLLEEAVERWRRLASSRHIALECRIDEEGSTIADSLLLHRLIDNLLDNAIRHTPEGGRVSASLTGATGQWLIGVSDSGSGVDPEVRDHLFERFARADAARGRRTGGAGLGLALCHAIVEAHGGTITLIDQSPGAVFEVRLPRPDPLPPPRARSASAGRELSSSAPGAAPAGRRDP